MDARGMARRTGWTIAGSLLMVGVSSAAPADVPVEVDQAVRRVADYFGGVKGMRVDLQTTVRVVPSDGRQPISATYAVAMQRPNKGAFLVRAGQPSPSYLCDGRQLTTFMPVLNQYTVKEAPAELDGIFQHTRVNSLSLGCVIARTLMCKSPYESLMKEVRGGKDLGLEPVGGVKCRHVRLVRPASDLELWIQEGEKPLLHQVMTFSGRGTTPPGTRAAQAQVLTSYTNWAIDPEIPEATYTFTPPPDSRKVDAFSTGSPQDSVGLDKK
jgi:hypothetical protein